MTPKLLSDEELTAVKMRHGLDPGWTPGEHDQGQCREDVKATLDHIDAQAAQIERYRDMVAAMESEIVDNSEQWDIEAGYLPAPRIIAPEADRTLDALFGFEVRT